MGGGLSVLTSLSSDELPVTDPANCKHLFCEKWGPNHYHCADCHGTLQDEDRIKDEERIIESIVDNSVPEDGVNRGVTIQFLFDFANACNCWDMTTRDVRRRFVMPATRASRCRFVELPEMSGVVGRATTFVSHTWGAKFGDLVAALLDGDADKSRVVWVDIFAVRQWPSTKPDLDFSAVVKQCKSFMIVCSSLPEVSKLSAETILARNTAALPAHVRTQIAFLRVWCLVEVHAALLSGATIVMKGGKFGRDEEVYFVSDSKMLQQLYYLIDIESAEATVASDKERILNGIRESKGGVTAVNEAIRGLLLGGARASDQPVIQCAACEDQAALQKLLQTPSEYIVAVSGCGYVDLLKRLIENGGDIDTVTLAENMSPLMAAAGGGHMACLELMIEKGCDVTRIHESGRTGLLYAAAGGHTAFVELLIKHGANVNGKDSRGFSALMFAASSGHTACCELLIRKGSKVNAADADGYTALIIAARFGHSDCVEVLTKNGSELTANVSGKTALISASIAGRTKCVELLIKAGSDLTVVCEGKTALEYAVEGGHDDTVKLLQSESVCKD